MRSRSSPTNTAKGTPTGRTAIATATASAERVTRAFIALLNPRILRTESTSTAVARRAASFHNARADIDSAYSARAGAAIITAQVDTACAAIALNKAIRRAARTAHSRIRVHARIAEALPTAARFAIATSATFALPRHKSIRTANTGIALLHTTGTAFRTLTANAIHSGRSGIAATHSAITLNEAFAATDSSPSPGLAFTNPPPAFAGRVGPATAHAVFRSHHTGTACHLLHVLPLLVERYTFHRGSLAPCREALILAARKVRPATTHAIIT